MYPISMYIYIYIYIYILSPASASCWRSVTVGPGGGRPEFFRIASTITTITINIATTTIIYCYNSFSSS